MGQTTAEDLYTGGCLCRVIRYELTAAPLAVLACHCTQCRRQSGAAFSVNLIVRASKLVILGWPAGWEDTETESGVPLLREHCGQCGTPIRSVPFAYAGVVALKAGSLDDPGPFAPTCTSGPNRSYRG